MLVIKVDQFMDVNNNKVIDVGESFVIWFIIENQGKGDVYNVWFCLVEQQGYDQYFDGFCELDGGNIVVGKFKEYIFCYIVKKELLISLVKINIYVFEVNGFDVDFFELIVNIQEYVMFCLCVVDY